MGRMAASQDRSIEACPFDKDDERHDQWLKGHREWRCKETLDLFETV